MYIQGLSLLDVNIYLIVLKYVIKKGNALDIKLCATITLTFTTVSFPTTLVCLAKT
jgi:hypothetical protein